MKFNERLMDLRKKAGLSQEELGFKLNVTRQTVSKWELGQTTPDMNSLKEMARIFEISIDELLDEKEKIEVMVNPIKNNNVTVEQYGETAPKKTNSKFVLIILLIVLIVAAVMVFKTIEKNNAEDKASNVLTEELGFFEKIFGDFFEQFSTMFDKNTEEIANQKDKISVSSFNGSMEIHSGLGMGGSVSSLLDRIVTVNKTKDRKVTVVFGNIESQEESKIKEIRNKLDTFADYDVSFDYDEDGYIYKATITKIKK